MGLRNRSGWTSASTNPVSATWSDGSPPTRTTCEPAKGPQTPRADLTARWASPPGSAARWTVGDTCRDLRGSIEFLRSDQGREADVDHPGGRNSEAHRCRRRSIRHLTHPDDVVGAVGEVEALDGPSDRFQQCGRLGDSGGPSFCQEALGTLGCITTLKQIVGHITLRGSLARRPGPSCGVRTPCHTPAIRINDASGGTALGSAGPSDSSRAPQPSPR